MVWILETNKYFNLNVPGFDIYRSDSRVGQHRGGVVMFVKSSLASDIKYMDMDTDGQIWAVLTQWPNSKLGGIYIPPSDSPHYSSAHSGSFARHTLGAGNVIAMGDNNARVGTPSITDTFGKRYESQGVKDNVVNGSGRTLENNFATITIW